LPWYYWSLYSPTLLVRLYFLKYSLPIILIGILFRSSCQVFVGVFGFSIMFNSPVPLAVTAALIGAIANTLRLELVDMIKLSSCCCRVYRRFDRRSSRLFDKK